MFQSMSLFKDNYKAIRQIIILFANRRSKATCLRSSCYVSRPSPDPSLRKIQPLWHLTYNKLTRSLISHEDVLKTQEVRNKGSVLAIV